MPISLLPPDVDATQVIDLVKFAIGASDKLPGLASEDPELAYRVIAKHRIIGRALAKVSDLPDCSSLQVRLTKRSSEIFERHHAAENAFASFIDTFCKGLDVALLKGQTHHYLTGHDQTLRYASDVDLCVSNSTVLRNRVLSAGAARNAVNARFPAHEYASAEHDGFHFDLHKFLPSWRRDIVDRPWTSQPDLVVADRTIEDRILIENIIATGRPITRGGSTFWIASPALATFITIAASYRDFIMHAASHLEDRPAIRISDLCEVRDAMDLADFDWEEFDFILRRFSNPDQMAWFGQLLEFWTGDRRVLDQTDASAAGSTSFKRIVAGAFWCAFPANPVRDAMRTIETTQLLRHNPSVALTLADGQEVATPMNTAGGFRTVGAAELDGRPIVFKRDAGQLEVELEIGAEVTDLTTIYFEINGEMAQWDNVVSKEQFELFAHTDAAVERNVWCKVNGHAVRLGIDLDASPVLDVALSVSLPQMPWSGYAGWLGLFRIADNPAQETQSDV